MEITHTISMRMDIKRPFYGERCLDSADQRSLGGEVCAFTEQLQVAVVGKDAIALLACDLIQDAGFLKRLDGAQGGGLGDA